MLHMFSVRSPPLSIGDVVAAEPPHPVAVPAEHPTMDRVGEPPEAIELELEQPRRIVERLLATDGEDRLQRVGRINSEPVAEESRGGCAPMIRAGRHAAYMTCQPESLRGGLQPHLISHVVLCGMSIAKDPAGSPAGVPLVMHLNGSRPVMPAYLPVPPVMI